MINDDLSFAGSVDGAPASPSRYDVLRTVVRGHAFAARPNGAALPTVGHRLQLVREHENPSDPWAVAVWHDDGRHVWRFGYLDRAVAVRLAPRLDAGMAVHARFDGWVAEPDGRWRRPLITIDRHVLLGLAEGLAEGSATGQRPSEQASTGRIRSEVGGRAVTALAAERPPRLWGRPPGARRRATPRRGED